MTPAAVVPDGPRHAEASSCRAADSVEPAWSCPVCGSTPQVPALGALPPDRMRVLLDWLADNYNRPGLRAGDIAEAAGVSPRRLQAICKQRFGCTPMRLLAEIRMRHAHLALTGQAPGPAAIAEAARLAGINRVSRFKAAYRSRYGAAPAIVAPQGASRAAAGPALGAQGVQPGASASRVHATADGSPPRGMRCQGVLTECGNGQPLALVPGAGDE